MKIGEMAEKTGISIRMLRYYEEQGLISPGRTGAGYRDYGRRELVTVERIKTLGACGMTLPVIRRFLPCALDGRSSFEPCDELRDILQRHIDDVDEQMKELDESRALLVRLLCDIDTRVNGAT
ncbi:MerR family transcriptional regulator [Paracoccus sp. (in: a-proteobacteria)]|uniref:MerR family transcriptional regulator n=1 Tax=Paracoccus sp. TaxID=267 RepID=UPI0026DF6866|nr:MerR family transcriptional regulator [Paracoccus sp. (in: a-proteobacteria)]